MFGISRFDRGHFKTTEGDYDASILDTSEEGVWLIPIDDDEVIFVPFDDIQAYKKDTFGTYDFDQTLYGHFYDD